MCHLQWATHAIRYNQEGPPKKGKGEYLVFVSSHFSSSALLSASWSDDEHHLQSICILELSATIFRNIQLIYNSNNKQKATFCVNAPAKICWLFNINILWMSLWILFTYFQPLLWKEEWILNQWIKMFYAQISLVLHGTHRCDMVCRCGWPHS